MLKNAKILIGITGSIAAYKVILLVRLLVKEGAEVKIIMTDPAKKFVSPLVLSTLSKNKVFSNLIEDNEWSNHVMLGRWADIFLIAPLSCNSLAKMANGLCDNLLLATCLSATCPVIAAPAMDEDMWKHLATQRNLQQLIKDRVTIISPVKGELASGLTGEGRMAEPEEILLFIREHFFRSSMLKGKKVLVTAGPTYEPIDPVRFIGNRSSGKMGFSIAGALYERGASVTLVSGPCYEKMDYKGIDIIQVESAEEMFAACKEKTADADIIIMNAAVSDYTPVEVATHKIKKKGSDMRIDLRPSQDILKWMGDNKKSGQFIVGFALETDNEKENARKKLTQKKLDAIILNSLRDQGAGFGHDTNTITIIDHSGEKIFQNKPKREVAQDIADWLITKVIG